MDVGCEIPAHHFKTENKTEKVLKREIIMTVYMLADGNGRYIRKDFSGKYSPVRSESLGDTWEQRNKAKNILENQLNKNLRRRYHVIEVEIPDKRKIDENMKIDLNCLEKALKYIPNVEEDSQIEKIENSIDSLKEFICNLENRKNYLNNELSDVDKEIIDIQHYIELEEKFNAYEGWLAFSMLRHRLKKRRQIKNELYIITQLMECKINSSMLSNIKDTIHALEFRVYTPRKLTNLFEKRGGKSV